MWSESKKQTSCLKASALMLPLVKKKTFTCLNWCKCFGIWNKISPCAELILFVIKKIIVPLNPDCSFLLFFYIFW